MTGVILAIVGLTLGGVLKGATGAGAPIIAVPLMAIYFDVPIAVATFAIPNLLANVWQCWTYRRHQLPAAFTVMFTGGGAIGALVGTVLLAFLPGSALTLLVAAGVFIYVAVRLARPDLSLAYALAARLAPLMGTAGGILFGAAGLSAPVTISFLNFMRLERAQFIATVTLFFTAMGVTQIPALFAFGIMDGRMFAISTAALIPVVVGMPVGAWLARYLSRETFDKIILFLLTAIAIRLAYQGLAG